jgi:hypothetical protein
MTRFETPGRFFRQPIGSVFAQNTVCYAKIGSRHLLFRRKPYFSPKVGKKLGK